MLCFLVAFQLNAKPKVKLTFDKSGDFKIIQFTDTHINSISGTNLEVFDFIRKLIEAEKPDLAIMTGDIITQDNPQETYRKLAEIYSHYKLPWAVVFGNHESEHNLQRRKLAEFLHKLPFCMNDDKLDTEGESDFVLKIASENGKTGAALYCMDSKTYSTLKPQVEGYGWFTISQVNWYVKSSRELTRQNGGNPLPALAFFHIPLPEYTQAWNNKSIQMYGVKNEDECSPEINTGMFSSMLTCGDVMGTFVGHDHINDYIALHHGIALAYGRVTKRMKGADDPLAGSRVIVLHKDNRRFDTWIRQIDGKKVLECTYPDSFKKLK